MFVKEKNKCLLIFSVHVVPYEYGFDLDPF